LTELGSVGEAADFEWHHQLVECEQRDERIDEIERKKDDQRRHQESK